MGKTFELLGLAGFNIFIAMILSVTFLTGGEPAQRHKNLTEANVISFITEMSDISSGRLADMDSYAITSYFMDHIAEDGIFKTVMRYDIPDMPSDERELEMDKLDFIGHTLQGMRSMANYETRTDVDFVEVAHDGKYATVMTSSYERGMMPVDDGSGEERLMPVLGTSYCEQSVILSNEVIKVAGAKCTTDLSFETGF